MEADIRRALERATQGNNGRVRVGIDRSHLNRQGTQAGRDFMSRFSASARSASPDFAGGLGSLAGKAFLGGFVAIAGGAALSAAAREVVDEFRRIIDTGLDFSKTMNNFQGVTRSTPAQMQQMGAAARRLGSDTTLAGASSSDAALAMTELAKAGFSVDQSMSAARGTLELATAGQLDAAKAAEIQANAMNAFDLDKTLATATHVSDLLANVAVASSADVADIGTALQQVGGVAHGFGVSLDDTVAALGILANAGIKGSDAGTLLKTTMQSITDQGNPAQGAIADLGLELYKLNDAGDKTFVGFRELFGQLGEARKRMTSEQFQANTNILFGSDAMRAAMIGDAAAFDDMMVQISRMGGGAELAGAQMQGLPGAVESFSNSVEGIRLDVFDAIGPQITDGLNQLVVWIGTHKPEIIEFFTGLADAALSAAQFVSQSIGGAARDLGSFLEPIGDVLGAMSKFQAWQADIRGDTDTANELRAIAEEQFGWGEGLQDLGEKINGVSFDEFRNRIREAGEQAADAARFTRDLGGAVAELKGADIVITDNTPEVLGKIDQTKFELQHLPNGDVKLVPKTQEATDQMNAWRAQQGADPIKPPVIPDTTQGDVKMEQFAARWRQTISGLPQAPGTPTGTPAPGGAPANPLNPAGVYGPRANGAIVARANGGLALQSIIKPSDAGLYAGRGAGTIFAEKETGGEAYIPLAPGKRARSMAILGEVARLFGLNVMDQGGISGIDQQILSQVPAGSYDSGAKNLALGLADCSSAVEDLVNILDGKSTAGGSLTTANAASLLPGMGFMQGTGGPGDFRIGYNSGHMQATLPDGTPFNWGSDSAAAQGGVTGLGADDPALTSQWYRPVNSLAGMSNSSGSYGAPDARDVREAEQKLADKESNLAIQEQELRELKADASESQRMRAKAERDKAVRERDDARADLEEAKRGKPTDGKSGSSSSGDGESLGQGIFSGILQGIGLDGSVFSNPFEWPNVKSAMALANYGGGLLKGALGGDQAAGGAPSGGGGLFPSIGVPHIADMLNPAKPGPGPIPGSVAAPNINITANGMDPKAVTTKMNASLYQNWRKNVGSVRPQ